jgi:DNA primase
MTDVLTSARPLADMLWLRETEPGSFDTPERRAALEARVAHLAASIGNDAVRKYYRRDFEARLNALFAAVRAPAEKRAYERTGPRGFGRAWPQRGSGPRGQTLMPLSPRLSTSPIVRGSRSALPPREALILLAVLNHPWLLDTHAEEFAELEFLHRDAERLRRAILDAAIGLAAVNAEELRATVAGRDLGPLLARVEAAITHSADWPARAGAAVEDVAQWWNHVVTLHRKARTLNKELQEAESALGKEPSEANLAWLRDVQGRLSELGGTEALIEGFGTLSGRPVRSL